MRSRLEGSNSGTAPFSGVSGAEVLPPTLPGREEGEHTRALRSVISSSISIVAMLPLAISKASGSISTASTELRPPSASPKSGTR